MKKTLTTLAAATLATAAHSAPVQWTTGTGANNHWYDFVILDSAINAVEAEAAAESSNIGGTNGYLATITSAEEQSFLNSIWPGSGSVTGQFLNLSYFLIGASDRDSEGNFEWIGGPEDGDALTYTNWGFFEPNNSGGGEDYTVAWWNDSATGAWNDVSGTANLFAYVVEYDTADMEPIPLPASLPLLLAALGGLFGLRKRISSKG